jgi:gluconate 2-dehydrogenase gamma chain
MRVLCVRRPARSDQTNVSLNIGTSCVSTSIQIILWRSTGRRVNSVLKFQNELHMPPSSYLDRRSLLKLGAGAAMLGGLNLKAIAAAAVQSRDAGAFTTLDADSGETLAAIAARILPTTDTPGAQEAGAVWFMDALLGDALADSMPLIQAGIADLNKRAGGAFAALDSAAQDSRLKEIEDGEFFGFVHFLTLAGTFTLGQYGGNRDNLGWKMLGLSDQHHWQPPFGHYDRDRHGEQDA